MDSISAMHLQEKKSPRCSNYFHRSSVVDESCRTAMVNWLFQISDALSLNRETVGIAMSFLDRFLSSSTARSAKALDDRHQFQLAAITAYFIAVKIYEPVQLGVDMLVKLCRGFYEQSAILAMEKDILYSLEWRVSSPTALDFMRQILELLTLNEPSFVENSQRHMGNATSDVHFSTFAPSVVGAACVAISFRESNVSPSSGQLSFWEQICQELELNDSKEFFDVQQRLQSKSSHSKKLRNVGSALTTLSSRSSYINVGDARSPVSINVNV
ncbi:hypothetical protein HJC23_013150 [Cyclotella cryptica]|uniref:Cyclin-like domain-containing protein n=1 Tax=Cyclotella cryptica TaxID=29204 RepID=A0ABD3QUH5_9STRA|eukprot:CCRYP_003966-RA/>CCRYP_003966-RA protein AED:0.24 eAED:0.24 QI:0/-1/0/1/-1/1/1/0/270